MKSAYVALGSNLGEPAGQLSQAIQTLISHPDLHNVRLSSWYKSQAIGGPADQPDYINAACELTTNLSPADLLVLLQSIEQDQGRVREVRWGPRTLDLDLIWYENFTSTTDFLTVPHPRAHQRAFVLQPLIELNADIALNGRSLVHWREQCRDQIITRLTDTEVDVRT